MRETRPTRGGHTDAVTLSQWFVRQAAKGSSRVYVEGLRPSAGLGSEDGRPQRWHSSVIARRVSSRLVETGSGTQYRLVGPYESKHRSCTNALPLHLARLFASGFPEDWQRALRIDIKNESPETRAEDPETGFASSVDIEKENAHIGGSNIARAAKGCNARAARRVFDNLQEAPRTAPNPPPRDSESLACAQLKLVAEGTARALADESQASKAACQSSSNPAGSVQGQPEEGKVRKAASPRMSSTLKADGSHGLAGEQLENAANEPKKVVPAARRARLNDAESSESDPDGEGEEGCGLDEGDVAELIGVGGQPRMGLPWLAEELRRLRRAHATCTAKPSRFWESVAAMVGSRTAQECYNQWCRVFVPQERKRAANSTKAAAARAGATKHKPAGRNTAKFRKQVRNVFAASEGAYTDDIFTSTPFRSRASASTGPQETDGQCPVHLAAPAPGGFDFDTGIPTPAAQDGEASAGRNRRRRGATRSGREETLSAHGSESSCAELSNDDRVDRDKIDYYIAGIAKRRKGPTRVAQDLAKSSTPTTTHGHRGPTGASVSEGGAFGKFTPGGSVQIRFDQERFKYSFSDDEAGSASDSDCETP